MRFAVVPQRTGFGRGFDVAVAFAGVGDAEDPASAVGEAIGADGEEIETLGEGEGVDGGVAG